MTLLQHMAAKSHSHTDLPHPRFRTNRPARVSHAILAHGLLQPIILPRLDPSRPSRRRRLHARRPTTRRRSIWASTPDYVLCTYIRRDVCIAARPPPCLLELRRVPCSVSLVGCYYLLYRLETVECLTTQPRQAIEPVNLIVICQRNTRLRQ